MGGGLVCSKPGEVGKVAVISSEMVECVMARDNFFFFLNKPKHGQLNILETSVGKQFTELASQLWIQETGCSKA